MFCRKNRKEGLASIVCQPMDVTVKQGKTAKFEVKTAKSRHLAYQWCFNGEPIESEKKGFRGTRKSRLVVSNVQSDKAGFYSCEIESLDKHGNPVRTGTRAAALGFSESILTVYPPQHQPMPPSFPSTNRCGPYCGYVLFTNGGAGFTPTSGDTMGVAYVQVGGTTLPQSSFNLLWRVSGTDFDCATDAAGSTKSFPCTYPKKYFITVYFTPGNCPAAGTDVVLNMKFQ